MDLAAVFYSLELSIFPKISHISLLPKFPLKRYPTVIYYLHAISSTVRYFWDAYGLKLF